MNINTKGFKAKLADLEKYMDRFTGSRNDPYKHEIYVDESADSIVIYLTDGEVEYSGYIGIAMTASATKKAAWAEWCTFQNLSYENYVANKRGLQINVIIK